MEEYQSLSHTRWDCKYHVVFIPKRRKGNPPAAKKKRGPAPKLQQHMERISQLPKPRQRMVMEMLEAVLAQSSR